MGTNYTATINDDIASFSGKEIRKIDLTYSSPFAIQLADESLFTSEKIVRHIPGRRIVAFGRWKGREVVAKLFFDRHRARTQLENDVRGVRTLIQRQIPTPKILYQGQDKGGTIQVLVFERIMQSDNLDEIWQAQTHPDDVWEAIKLVTTEIATQHVFGIVQHDLHMKNFLVTPKTIYTLDGAQIELRNPILPKVDSMKSMALFLSQLGIGQEKLQTQLYQEYSKARGWTCDERDIADLFLEIKHINERRWLRYARKVFRDCTAYKRVRTFTRKGMYDRQYESEEMQQFLQNPDSFFQLEDVSFLKKGRSSTVIKARLCNRDVVIKRYNLKSITHRLRRLYRQTRAATCWRLANKLALFGVKTAKPIAYIESNVLGMRGTSYYVTEYVEGQSIDKVFVNDQDYLTHRDFIQMVVAMLKKLAKLDVTHGDLKASNIIINQYKEPVLIDLDGAAEHLSLGGLRRAWKKEIKRFLKNFDDLPTIKQIFADKLSN